MCFICFIQFASSTGDSVVSKILQGSTASKHLGVRLLASNSDVHDMSTICPWVHDGP